MNQSRNIEYGGDTIASSSTEEDTVVLSKLPHSQPSVDELCENPKLCTKLESVADGLDKAKSSSGDNSDLSDLEESDDDSDLEGSCESIVSDGAVVGGDNGVTVSTVDGDSGGSNTIPKQNEVKRDHRKDKKPEKKDEACEGSRQRLQQGNHPVGTGEDEIAATSLLATKKTKVVRDIDDKSKRWEEADEERLLSELKCRGAYVLLGVVVVIIIATLVSVILMKAKSSPSPIAPTATDFGQAPTPTPTNSSNIFYGTSP